MAIKIADTLVPANEQFKVADSSNIEYRNDSMEGVDDVKAGLDHIYDIITAVPTFYLASPLKTSSDGSSRTSVVIGTRSTQGSTCKINILNKNTGNTIAYSGPATSEHTIDLGLISTFGTYEYAVTAVDNYNNAMVVDTNRTTEGSFDAPLGQEREIYTLKFYVVSGTVSMSITNMESSVQVNGNSNLYAISNIDETSNINNLVDINGKVILQYPDVSTENNPITESVNYSINTRVTYLKAIDNGNEIYYPSHKYFDLLKLINDGVVDNILPTVNNYSLYYKCEDGSYVSIEEYDNDESLYTLNSSDSDISTLYDFVESNTGNELFIKTNNNRYELISGEAGSGVVTYEFIPTEKKAIFTSENNSTEVTHRDISEVLNFKLQNVYFLNERQHTIKFQAEMKKSNSAEPEKSTRVYRYVYPGNSSTSISGNGLRTVIASNIDEGPSINADEDLTFSFVPVSFNTGVQNNIKYYMDLYYKRDGEDDVRLKSVTREGCKNGVVQNWIIGRLQKGSGTYYIKMTPKSNDGSVTGSEFYVYFNARSSISNAGYTTSNLVAYFDAQDKSNDDRNPDMWYPRVINSITREEDFSENYFFRLSGLNYKTNGWKSYIKDSKDDKYKQPHLSFTGDSYALAYRLNSSNEEIPLTISDIVNGTIDGGVLGQASIELMFRTRCIGEMKACVFSSRLEESNSYGNYTYSDTDPKISRPGITISHNKLIANTTNDYASIPYTNDEWKHVTIVIDTNAKTDVTTTSGELYNPFPSMKIYIDGVLTSITDITGNGAPVESSYNDYDDYLEAYKSYINELFGNSIQFTLNGHLNGNVVENCGESEIRLMRIYNKALSNNEVVDNFISSIYDTDDRKAYEIKNSKENNIIPIVYFVKNPNITEDNIRKKNTKVTSFNEMLQITDKADSKVKCVNCTMYYSYPSGTDTNGEILWDTKTYDNVDVYLQGTSTLQFPVKNFKIRMYKNTNGTEDPINGKNGAKKLKFLPPNMDGEWVEDTVFTLKCDFMESGHMNNTPTAKFYHHVVRELVDRNIDDTNTDTYDLSKRDYVYTQDNERGKYYIDKKSNIQEITDESYSGPRYARESILNKSVASPSRSYFSFEEDSNGLIVYTSKRDLSKVKYIATITKNNETYDTDELTLEQLTTYLNNSEEYPTISVKSVFDKANRYYIRLPKSDYSGNKWVEYSPLLVDISDRTNPVFTQNDSQFGRILYKINKKYRDSVDGFPCIVYYSDTFYSYSNDVDSMPDLKLLGTMMWNLDKTAKQLGFSVNPVFEDEYREYLKSAYVQLKEYDNILNEDVTENMFVAYCMTDNDYIDDINVSITNDTTYSIIGDKIYTFSEFYNDDCWKYNKLKPVDLSATDYYTSLYFKYDNDYIPFWELHENRQSSELYGDTNVTWRDIYTKAESVASTNNGDNYWVEKVLSDLKDPNGNKYDGYATVPAYTHRQKYTIDNENGTYVLENGEYVLADVASTSPIKYSMTFDDYRTYFVNREVGYEKNSNGEYYKVEGNNYSTDPGNRVYNIYGELVDYDASNEQSYAKYSMVKWNYENNDKKVNLDSILLRTTDQCVLSYEAATNTKYAAGTFYDITEAYKITYSDDYLNSYYESNFYDVKNGENVPRNVSFVIGSDNTQISPSSNGDMISIDDFKTIIFNNIINGTGLNPLDTTQWPRDNFFIDRIPTASGDVIKPGPYVFVTNDNVICEASTSGSMPVVYSKEELKTSNNTIKYLKSNTAHEISINEDIPEDLRYKFKLTFKSVGEDESDTRSFDILDSRSYIGENLSGTDDSYIDYMQGSFEMRYSFVEEQDILADHLKKSSINNEDEVTWTPLKELIKWVINSDITDDNKDQFKNEFSKHFDVTYAITYYLQMILFGQADNAGKNSMWDTWDGKKFYIRPYDMDTQVGLNNKGLFNVPTSAEINIEQSASTFIDNTSTKLGNISNRFTDKDHRRYRSYTTSTSRFWNNFAKAYKEKIISAYANLRNSGMYTKDYIMNYYKEHITDVIGERYYNADMNQKYLNSSVRNYKDYLILLMGNRLDQFTKWMDERIIFCDTLFGYKVNDSLNSQLEIRSEATTNTVDIAISVFSPQYVEITVGMGNDAVFSAYVDTDSTYTYNGVTREGVLFTIPITGQNKEISIYGGGNIKEIFNINSLTPSVLNFGSAKKITGIDMINNVYIESLNVENAKYLRELSVEGCTKLTGNLNASNCTNLQKLDISKSALTGVSLADGGNLKSFIARDTTISNVSFNNLQELKDIVITNSNSQNPITKYSIVGCPLINTLNFNTYNALEDLSISDCAELENVYIESNRTLKNLSVTDCNSLRLINLQSSTADALKDLNFSTLYGLETLNVSSCKHNDGINIRLPFFASEEIARNVTDIDNIPYSHRWHNLKYLSLGSSDIRSITYGEIDNSNYSNSVLDLSQLDSLIGSYESARSYTLNEKLSFGNCPKFTTIKGVRYYGPTYSIFTKDSKLQSIEDSYTYSTDNSAYSILSNCAELDNIDGYHLNLSTTDANSRQITVQFAFSNSRQTNNILRHVLNSGRQYDGLTIVESINSSDNVQDYLMRDYSPLYKVIEVTSPDKYTLGYYDSNGTKMLGYCSESAVDEDTNLAKYYKVNGGYVVDRFGLYTYTEKYVNNTNKYFVKLRDPIYTMQENDSLETVQSKYAYDGNVIKGLNGVYYRYFNGSWKTLTSLFTFYNMNTYRLAIRSNSNEYIYMPGGINKDNNYINTYRYENREYEYYSDSADIDINANNANNMKDLLDVFEPNTTFNNTINDINKGFYKIYDGSDTIIYKKHYREVPTTSYNYISNAYGYARGTHSNTPNSSLDISKFLVGLELATECRLLFQNNSKLYTQDKTNAISEALKKLKSADNIGSMFENSNIRYLRSDIFSSNGMSNVMNTSSMFRGSTTFLGFVDSNGRYSYYTLDNSGNYVSILPKGLKNAKYMFANSGITMNNDDVNGLLGKMESLTNATSMFMNCQNINGIATKPFKDTINISDISSMFMNCGNLEAELDNEFTLADNDKEYTADNIYAYSLFANCGKLKGYISKDFFGDVNGNGLVNIVSLGSDLNISGHNPANSDNSELNKNIGGAFANTMINGYHEEFLYPLTKLKDVTALFAKINSTNDSKNDTIPLSTSTLLGENDISLAMYGYINSSNVRCGGIPENLFSRNPLLENASYVFAGNRGLGRNSNIVNKNNYVQDVDQTGSKLPNIFKHNPNIKYLIGTFMGTVLHKENVTYSGNNIVKNMNYYAAKYSSTGDLQYVSFDSDNFFKTIDEDGNYNGMDKLISVKSIFDSSDYKPYTNGESEGISAKMFEGCTSLEDVSSMFRNNLRLESYVDPISGKSLFMPVELFNSCRDILKNTSYMFQGCINNEGELPTGDDCWLNAYKNYLNNIKTNNSVLALYPILEKQSVEDLFDILQSSQANEYKKYKIDGGVNDDEESPEYIDQILSFTEFRNMFKSIYSNKEYYPSSNVKQIRGLFVNDKYSTMIDSSNNYQCSISDIYLKDRYVKVIDEYDYGKYYINASGKASIINPGTEGSRTILSFANEIGEYAYNINTAAFEKYNMSNIDYYSKDNGTVILYVKKSLVESNDSNASNIMNNSKAKSIISNGSIVAKNIFPIKQSLLSEISTRPMDWYDNKMVLDKHYDSLNGATLTFANSINDTEYTGTYNPGILGSCKNLSDCSHMFEGCINLYAAVPKDIFSAESTGTRLTNLTDISYMFRTCVRLGLSDNVDTVVAVRDYIDKTNVARNPEYMYSRTETENSYTLIVPNTYITDASSDVSNNYLVPTDWLSNTPNLINVSYLFTNIATIRYNAPPANRPAVADRRAGGLVIPSKLFNGLNSIYNISYIFYGAPLLRGDIGKDFIRSSLNYLNNARAAFAFTSISGIGDSNQAIFEQNGINTKLSDINGLFFCCVCLPSSIYPRFEEGKFSNINVPDNKKSAFAGSSINLNPELKNKYTAYYEGNRSYSYLDGNEGGYGYLITPSNITTSLKNDLIYDLLITTSNK